MSFSADFISVRFLIDEPLGFPSALWGIGGSSSGPSVIRPPHGLGVPPRFLSLDLFLEVISLVRQFLFSWPGAGEWISVSGPTSSRGLQSCWLVKSSVCGLGLHIGWMRVTSLDCQEDTW